MNLRLASTLGLVASLLLLGWQAHRISRIDRDYATLAAEYNSRTSWGNVGLSMAKSFVDGLTLGETGEEGIFTESKKWDRFASDFARRRNFLLNARVHAVQLRAWSITFAIGSFVVLVGCNLTGTGGPTEEQEERP